MTWRVPSIRYGNHASTSNRRHPRNLRSLRRRAVFLTGVGLARDSGRLRSGNNLTAVLRIITAGGFEDAFTGVEAGCDQKVNR